jgi:hypothetical protein
MKLKIKRTLKKLFNKIGLSLAIIQQVRYETELFRVRLKNAISLTYRIKVMNYRKQTQLKINLGCGEEILNNWINVDSRNTKKVNLRLDLRQQLPFADNRAQFIFSEHFIEHLTYPKEAFNLLSECYRVLAHRGVLRISSPDGE